MRYLATIILLAMALTTVKTVQAAEYTAGTPVTFEYELIREITVNGIDGSSHTEYEAHGMLTFYPAQPEQQVVYVKVFFRELPATVDYRGYFRYDGQVVLDGVEHTYLEIPMPSKVYTVNLPDVAR